VLLRFLDSVAFTSLRLVKTVNFTYVSIFILYRNLPEISAKFHENAEINLKFIIEGVLWRNYEA